MDTELWSPAVTGNILVLRGVNPYPFDSYEQQLVAEVESSEGRLEHDTVLVKTIAGRRLLSTGYPDLLEFTLERSLPQKIFVTAGALVYLLASFRCFPHTLGFTLNTYSSKPASCHCEFFFSEPRVSAI